MGGMIFLDMDKDYLLQGVVEFFRFPSTRQQMKSMGYGDKAIAL